MASLSTSAAGPSAANHGIAREDFVRIVVEFIICVVICILVVTTWLVEPFIVPSGSMATTLLGPHLEVTCAECGHPFVVGTTPHNRFARVRCPNCDALTPPLDREPVIQGDRLLVSKQAFRIRPPVRFEVAVFRRPGDAAQAYVKRIVGLPGESIEIAHGELFIDGELVRKSLYMQRALRAPVHSLAHLAPLAPAPWRPLRPGSKWRITPNRLEHVGTRGDPPQSADPPLDWLDFYSLKRVPGDPETFVELPLYDRDPYNLLQHARRIPASPALPSGLSPDPTAEATSPPVAETPADWAFRAEHGLSEVHDVGLTCRVLTAGQGILVLRANWGDQEFHARITPDLGHVELLHGGRTVAERDYPEPLFVKPTRVEWSITDLTATLIIGGEPCFPAYAWPVPKPWPAATLSPLGIATDRLAVDIQDLEVFRDIYYTDPGHSLSGDGTFAGIGQPYTLEADEYFVLGDNSPFSDDSRSWPEGPVVPADLLIGKAVIVHLPSTGFDYQGRWFQVPDWNQMRYIR